MELRLLRVQASSARGPVADGKIAGARQGRSPDLRRVTASADFALPSVAIATCAVVPMCCPAEMSKEFAEHLKCFVSAFAAAVRVAWH